MPLLKVLLIEDNPAKKSRLLEFLNSKKSVLFDTVDTALSVGDALTALKARSYDLLIVDVVIPAILGGEAHEDHAIDLFTQIDEGVDIKRPKYSVAISAVAELGKAAK